MIIKAEPLGINFGTLLVVHVVYVQFLDLPIKNISSIHHGNMNNIFHIAKIILEREVHQIVGPLAQFPED